MRRPLPNFSRRGNVLFFVLIGFVLIGLGVAVAGGICIEKYGEETDWANVLFLSGMLAIIAFGALIGILGYAERNSGAKEDDARAAQISPHTYYAGGTFVTFTEEGVTVEREEGEPFAEGGMTVPYEDVLVYRSFERRTHKSKGKEICVLQVPARYFGEESLDGTEGVASCGLQASERLNATLQSFGVTAKDFREIPVKTSKRLPLKVFRGAVNKVGRNVVYVTAAILFCALFALSVICWAGLLEGGVEGGFIVLAANIGLTAFILCLHYFGTRNCCVLYDRGFKLVSGYASSAFFVWEQIEGIKKIEAGDEAFVLFDFGYMGIVFLDKKGLYPFLRETFPEKCGEEEWQKNESSED